METLNQLHPVAQCVIPVCIAAVVIGFFWLIRHIS